MKQLDMEQLEETPTSTTTDSSRDIAFDPALNPRPLLPTDAAEEEGELVTEADMPPLTGEKVQQKKKHLTKCTQLLDPVLFLNRK